MRLDKTQMPKTAEHLRSWIIQLMLDGITPPTAYNNIKDWVKNEEAKQELHSIHLI